MEFNAHSHNQIQRDNTLVPFPVPEEKEQGARQTLTDLPLPALRSMRLVGNPHVDISRIIEPIRPDQELTACILRLANSERYQLPRTVTSVHAAAVFLGVKTFYELLVTCCIAPQLNKALQGYRLAPTDLLLHALWVAIAAEQLCRITGKTPSDTLFLSGVLHDLGKLVLNPVTAESLLDIQSFIRRNQSTHDAAECKMLGLHHGEAGAQVLERWGLPNAVIAAARYHHEPAAAGEHVDEVILIHVADALAYAEDIGCGIDGMRYRTSETALQHLDLRASTIGFVAEQTHARAARLVALLTD